VTATFYDVLALAGMLNIMLIGVQLLFYTGIPDEDTLYKEDDHEPW